jgi:hypothetical protein
MSEITAGELWKRREGLEEATANLLGRMLLGFGRLEFALGLCVRNIDGARADESAFAGRLKALSRVVSEKCSPESELAKAYGAWIRRADSIRQLRNEMIHGRWGVDPHTMEVVNVIASPDCSEQREVRYAVAELEQLGAAVVELHTQLGRLQTRWPI